MTITIFYIYLLLFWFVALTGKIFKLDYFYFYFLAKPLETSVSDPYLFDTDSNPDPTFKLKLQVKVSLKLKRYKKIILIFPLEPNLISWTLNENKILFYFSETVT